MSLLSFYLTFLFGLGEKRSTFQFQHYPNARIKLNAKPSKPMQNGVLVSQPEQFCLWDAGEERSLLNQEECNPASAPPSEEVCGSPAELTMKQFALDPTQAVSALMGTALWLMC